MTAALLKLERVLAVPDRAPGYPPSDDGGPIEARARRHRGPFRLPIRRLMTAALLKPGFRFTVRSGRLIYPPSDDGGPIEALRSMGPRVTRTGSIRRLMTAALLKLP